MSTWADAVGVLLAVCATSSATLRSISCPIPVSTGRGMAAMARATSSLSNGARSARDPPPRTTTTASKAEAMRARRRSAHTTRRGAVAALVLLDELEVDVPGPRLPEPLHLAPHPHVLRDRAPERVPDRRVELGDGKGRLVHVAHRSGASGPRGALYFFR